MKNFILTLILAIISLVGFSSCIEHITEEKTFPLIAFTDANGSSINGSFILGCGSMDGTTSKSFYRVIVDMENGGMKPLNIPSNLVTLEYSDNPSITICVDYEQIKSTDKDFTIKGIFDGELNLSKDYCRNPFYFIIRIPKGTITYDNSFDGK